MLRKTVQNWISWKRILGKNVDWKMRGKNLRKKDWPKFSPQRVTPRGSKFRIGTRDLFVDVPAAPVDDCISIIHRIEEESRTAEDAYAEVQEKLGKLNKSIQRRIEEVTGEECDWIKIVVKELSISEKPYNIQLRIDWNKLLQFLDAVAKKENLPLSKKYIYIHSCRNFFLPPESEKGKTWISEKNFKKAQRLAKEDIEKCVEKIGSLRRRVENIAQKCRKKEISSLFYLYSKDFVSSLHYLRRLLRKGRLTACYRELGNSLEELSEALFYDTITFKEIEDFDKPFILDPPTHDWFKVARDKGGLLRSLGELRKCFRKLINSIFDFYEDETSIEKKDIWNRLVRNLNTSLFVAGSSVGSEVSPFEIPKEAKEKAKKRAKETVRKILFDLTKKKSLSDEENMLVKESVKEIMPPVKALYVKFPTGSFARQFVSKFFSEDLNKFFNRYSHFSHAYPDSWQIAPGSSILEYKIFAHKFSKFSVKVKNLLEDYKNLL